MMSNKILHGYRLSYSWRTSQGMVAPFTRGATTKMAACSLALWGLAQNPDSALWPFKRQLAFLHNHALILDFWHYQNLLDTIRHAFRHLGR